MGFVLFASLSIFGMVGNGYEAQCCVGANKPRLSILG